MHVQDWANQQSNIDGVGSRDSYFSYMPTKNGKDVSTSVIQLTAQISLASTRWTQLGT